MNFTVKSVGNQSHQPLISSIHNHRPIISRPISFISFRAPIKPSAFAFTPIRAAASDSASFNSSPAFPISQNSSDVKVPNSLPFIGSKSSNFSKFPLPFIQTSIIATAAAVAALFFSQFCFFSVKPAFASSTATVETTSDDAISEEEKEKALEEHLLSYPNDIEALKSLMEIRIKNQKTQEAILIVEKLIELEPDEVEWPLMKSHLHSYVGETQLAKSGFNGIISKDPLRVEAYHGLVMAASQDDVDTEELNEIKKRIDQAMIMCKKENKKNDLRDFRLLLAQIHVIESKYDEAIKLYQDLVKEEPRDFRPYLCQGIIFTLLRNKVEAEKNFEKYRRLVPSGHPYARYFEDNMIATKVFAQKVENEKTGSKG